MIQVKKSTCFKGAVLIAASLANPLSVSSHRVDAYLSPCVLGPLGPHPKLPSPDQMSYMRNCNRAFSISGEVGQDGVEQAFTGADLKALFTLEELKRAGATATCLKSGFSLAELNQIGFTATELKEARFISP